MEAKTMYGISFVPEIINNSIVMLKPVDIVEGTSCGGTITNRYEDVYNIIKFTTNIDEYSKMYGLGVLSSDLIDYAKRCGFPESIQNDADICAKVYLQAIQKYVYFLEKKDNFTFCYAMDLTNKKTFPIDLDKSAINQLKKEFPNARVELNDKEKNNNCSNVYEPKFISPRFLHQQITKRVIGQDDASFAVSATVCRNLRYNGFEQMKSNVLLYGPSGCGKTEIARTLAKELDAPIIIEDMTTYTASGYVGDSVKKILRRLYYSCNCDMQKAEHGIIVLDEIDKLATTNEKETVNKSDVQEELLKVIEGGDFDLNDSNRTSDELIMNTSNIIFILCGAFSKFQNQLRKRSIGFTSQKEPQKNITMTNEDLKDYGLMPELIGRISTIVPIQKLGVKEYEEILYKSKISCLKVYENALWQIDKVKVTYDDKKKFVNAVATKAEKLGIGARGLKSVVDNVFINAVAEISDELPNNRLLVLSSETVDNPKVYQLKKVRGENNYELSKRNGVCVK